MPGSARLPRRLALDASLYGRSAARVLLSAHRGREPDDRLVFVVGSPRSGTTFVAEAIGAQPGFTDLGEVYPLKAAIPELVGLPVDQAGRRVRDILERVRRLALVRRRRAVEQTPEMAFLVGPARLAYPRARVVHVVRDGRDVVCSLLERGWLRAGRHERDDAGLRFGAHPRFWVERERRDEFTAASEATRAAWVWRRYVTAARSQEPFELRYEPLVSDPGAAAERLARYLGSDPEPLAQTLSLAHARSVGRWRDDLTAAQLDDVVHEAGALLSELGYLDR